MDWGEAEVVLAGERVTAQMFVLRLCYSRKLFVRAYPTQRQEAFFDGHVAAFHYLGGMPRRLTYDNLSTAVLRVLQGRNREEQQAFIAFRSHYLFDSRFCTPGQGHEKGGVESGVGYARRNFLVPLPEVADYDELNALLLAACQADDTHLTVVQVSAHGGSATAAHRTDVASRARAVAAIAGARLRLLCHAPGGAECLQPGGV